MSIGNSTVSISGRGRDGFNRADWNSRQILWHVSLRIRTVDGKVRHARLKGRRGPNLSEQHCNTFCGIHVLVNRRNHAVFKGGVEGDEGSFPVLGILDADEAGINDGWIDGGTAVSLSVGDLVQATPFSRDASGEASGVNLFSF